jgi:hypothetical protein
MKDLLIFTADADAEAFIKGILDRRLALQTGNFSFDVKRHPLRDSGMIQSGAELVRNEKGRYKKIILIWDYHGSGKEFRFSPAESSCEMQNKLDSFTWKNNSFVVQLVPELEQWLWHCESSLQKHFGITDENLKKWSLEYANLQKNSIEQVWQKQPKELFEYLVRRKLKRTISPRDFAEIGKQASIVGLEKCETFLSLVSCLREWFPA